MFYRLPEGKSKDVKVQEQSSFALRHLCRESSEYQLKAASLGALELLVKALRRHPRASGVHREVCMAFAQCCNNSDENKQQAVSLGALELMLVALRTHPQDEEVQSDASLALGQLCFSDSDKKKRQEEALQLGAFEVIATNLPAHPTGEHFHRFFALGALCQGEDAAAARRRHRALRLGVLRQMEDMRRRSLGFWSFGSCLGDFRVFYRVFGCFSGDLFKPLAFLEGR